MDKEKTNAQGPRLKKPEDANGRFGGGVVASTRNIAVYCVGIFGGDVNVRAKNARSTKDGFDHDQAGLGPDGGWAQMRPPDAAPAGAQGGLSGVAVTGAAAFRPGLSVFSSDFQCFPAMIFFGQAMDDGKFRRISVFFGDEIFVGDGWN